MTWIEAAAAVLLLLGSALVIHAVWAADVAATGAAARTQPSRDEAPDLRRAA